jgi:hypothetical protein
MPGAATCRRVIAGSTVSAPAPLLERRQSNHHRIAFVEKGDKGEIYGVMV